MLPLLGSHYQTGERLGSRLKSGLPIGRSVCVKVRSTKKDRQVDRQQIGMRGGSC